MFGHQMAFRWRADAGPLKVVFESSLPSSIKKNVVKVKPTLEKNLDPRMDYNGLRQTKFLSYMYDTNVLLDVLYYTIIDFNEVDIRIYLPEKVIIHRGR